MTRELDERQEMLHRIDTNRTRPMVYIAPSRNPRRTRWQRLLIRIKALLRQR
jgi:hypothetical protein